MPEARQQQLVQSQCSTPACIQALSVICVFSLEADALHCQCCCQLCNCFCNKLAVAKTWSTCRLGKLWMYEAPTMFWTLWHLVSPFIDPETKQKVVFVSSKSAIAEFQKAIDPSVSVCVCWITLAHTLCLSAIGHSCLFSVHTSTRCYFT